MSRIVIKNGHNFHVGGCKPAASVSQFSFHDYISKLMGGGCLPACPEESGWTGEQSAAALRQVYLNNLLGCCVAASTAHLKGVWTGYSGLVDGGQVFADDDIRSLYTLLSGGVFDPANPAETDHGCDIQTALNALVSQGYPDGDRILGYIGVDATNWAHVCLAAWLFEGLITGSQLSDNALKNLPTDPTGDWDMSGEPVPGNGHSMALVAWGPDYARLSTWGRDLRVKREDAQYAFARKQGGQLYAVLSQDVLIRATLRAPTGFDFDTLKADMAELRNE